MSVVLSGEERSGAVDLPILRRLRHRRLLSYLRLQGLEATFGSLVNETDAFFSVVHLQEFIKAGLWRDAIGYLSRFLPYDHDVLSVEAQVLHRLLVVHRCLADILAGTKEGDEAVAYFTKYRSHDRTLSNGALRLRCIMLTALHAKQQLRALDWERVRGKISEIVYELVHRTPELSSVVLLPAGPMKPHTVLPVHSSSLHRPRGQRKKRHGRPRPYALANCYLRKRSLLSSSYFQEPCNELMSKPANWVADILDESLKAGEPRDIDQEHPQQRGAASATVTQTVPGNMTCPARNPGMPSVANTGSTAALGSWTSFVSLPGPATNLGMKSMACAAGTSAPISQATFGNLSGPAKPLGMPSVSNAGAASAPDSETMPGNVTGPDRIPGLLSVANTGEPATCVLSPGIFLRTMLSAPVSQPVFVSLTSPAENS